MDILALLDSKGLDYTHKGGDEYGITCPRQELHAGGSDSRPSFDINVVKFKANCPACGFSLNEAGLHAWLLGEELDDLTLQALRINGALKRGREGEEPLLVERTAVVLPTGRPWTEEYRNISAATYQRLGAFKSEFGRYQNRLCFPITLKGEVIGIDARALGDEQPKYLRNKNSSCKAEWLYPYDLVKEELSKVRPGFRHLLIGEGIFHAVNALDKGFLGLAFFGANNWSASKIMLLLGTGVEGITYFPDPDRAGFQVMQKVCSSLHEWIPVQIANMSPFVESKKDLGDLTKEEIAAAIDSSGKPALPHCLLENWEYKIVWGAGCSRRKCPFNSYGKCGNPLYAPMGVEYVEEKEE
jgi:hypothetical protein